MGLRPKPRNLGRQHEQAAPRRNTSGQGIGDKAPATRTPPPSVCRCWKRHRPEGAAEGQACRWPCGEFTWKNEEWPYKSGLKYLEERLRRHWPHLVMVISGEKLQNSCSTWGSNVAVGCRWWQGLSLHCWGVGFKLEARGGIGSKVFKTPSFCIYSTECTCRILLVPQALCSGGGEGATH